MKTLLFVLWLALYPLISSVNSYVCARTRKLTWAEEVSEGARVFATLVELIFYIFIAVLLWRHQ